MKFILSSLTFIFSFHTWSQTHYGSVSSATGNAGVATVEVTDGVHLNPATLPFYSKKQFTISYSDDLFLLTLADNGREALFPAALSYEKSSDEFIKTTSYKLALAYEINPKLSLGVHGSMKEIQLRSTEEKHKHIAADFGLLWKLIENLNLGAVYKNYAFSNTDLPDAFDKNSSFLLGLSYDYLNFAQFRVDIEKLNQDVIGLNSGAYNFKFGLESYINEWIVTRFGYMNDNIRSLNLLTAGIGFTGPQFGLHYAYQKESNDKQDSRHIIDLNIPF